MPLTDQQQATIEALARNEDAIGDLYKAYSELVPDHAHYFSRMVDEERGHAIWLRRMISTVENKDLDFSRERFNMDIIERSITHVRNMEKEARQKGIDVYSAASNSAVLENALLEKKFFEIFEGDSDEVKRIMVNLARATQEHREEVRRFLEQFDKKE